MEDIEEIPANPSAGEKQNAGTKPEPASSTRGFWALFIVQLQGAFSDNLFKFLVVFTSIKSASEEAQAFRVFLVAAVAALPFILFSMLAGGLASRFSKGRVITWTKILEIGIMILGVFALKELNFNLVWIPK